MARLVESTFGFRPRMTKIAPDFNFPKVLMVVDDYWVPARIDGVTVDFPGGNGKNFTEYSFAKISFFILYTLLSDVGNMVSPEIGAYPKLALIGAFGHKSDFFLS